MPLNWRIVLAGILVGMFSLFVLPSLQIFAYDYGSFVFVWGVFLLGFPMVNRKAPLFVRVIGYIFLIALLSMLCVGLLMSILTLYGWHL